MHASSFAQMKKIKKILAAATILFALVSLVIAVRDIASANYATTQPEELKGPGERDGYYVVLFRGSSYCPTCDIMQDLTGKFFDAADNPFAEKIRDGNLSFMTINFELPGNEHNLFDYDLYTTTIVLIEQRDGLTARWKNLHDSWEKAEKTDYYEKYLEEEMKNFMNDRRGA